MGALQAKMFTDPALAHGARMGLGQHVQPAFGQGRPLKIWRWSFSSAGREAYALTLPTAVPKIEASCYIMIWSKSRQLAKA